MAISCSPKSLLEDAKCVCVQTGRQMDVLIWLFATIAGVSTDPSILMQNAKCVCIPPGRQMDVLINLACAIVNGGGTAKVCILGGVGAPAMPVPCDFSAYVQQPGPNFGLWLGDLSTGWSNVLAQGP